MRDVGDPDWIHSRQIGVFFRSAGHRFDVKDARTSKTPAGTSVKPLPLGRRRRRSVTNRLGGLVQLRPTLSLVLAFMMLVLIPSSASATPPTLVSVGQQARYLTASWSLPAGEETSALVASHNSTPDPFFGLDAPSYLWDSGPFGQLTTTQTSFTSPAPLNSGTWYVRVASCPEASGGGFCAPAEIEWSNTLSLNIAEPPSPPPPPSGGGDGDTEEQAQCPEGNRYSGQTSQGESICFNLVSKRARSGRLSGEGADAARKKTRKKKFVERLEFTWTANCDVGFATGLYTVDGLMKVRKKGKFKSSTFFSDLTLEGKVKGQNAHGTLRVQPGGGACDTGNVEWDARRG